MDDGLRTRVQSWIAEDPDPDTRAGLEKLLASGDEKELADRFAGTLEFGTAGLRGVLGGGPNRMNRAVVRRTTAGLAKYLEETVEGAKRRGVVVGYDGRRLSREFAEETAGVLAAAGFTVHLFERLGPTPLTAFAVTRLGAAAGVMVTASHNPPEYNGYKVYWENGAQIIPPHDKGISSRIDAAGPVPSIRLLSLDVAAAEGRLNRLGADMESQYLEAIRTLSIHTDVARDYAIAYTPLHGVGGELATRALAQAGFERVFPVTEQFTPDGAFPTVRFPNPEEKGAMDRVIALAKEKGAELVIANDPDADRLAVALPDGKGGYVQLSGDQVGALLAYYLLTEGGGGPERLVCTTIVSSALLSQMASALGVQYAETLTGFKWIANTALKEQQARGLRFVMGYEEALGYTIGEVVRDKDGISAALVFAELAGHCRRRGVTVLQYLEELYRRFGLCRSAQHSATLPGSEGLAKIRGLMEQLRATKVERVGTTTVVATRDLSRGVRTTAEGEQPLTLPKSDVLVYELEGGGRITVRPSGTEPKIKCYFELREVIAPQETFYAAQQRIDARIRGLAADFLSLSGIP